MKVGREEKVRFLKENTPGSYAFSLQIMPVSRTGAWEHSFFINHPLPVVAEEHEGHEEGQKIIPAGGAKHEFWDESNVCYRNASSGTKRRAPTLRARCPSVRDQLFGCGFAALCSSWLNCFDSLRYVCFVFKTT